MVLADDDGDKTATPKMATDGLSKPPPNHNADADDHHGDVHADGGGGGDDNVGFLKSDKADDKTGVLATREGNRWQL